MLKKIQTCLVAMIFILVSAVALAEEANTYHVHVNGLACPFCVYGLEKKFGEIDEVKNVNVNLKTGLVEVTMENGKSLEEALARQTVEDAGFTVEAFEKAEMMEPDEEDG